jgi:DNA-binding NtrC family response regulator
MARSRPGGIFSVIFRTVEDDMNIGNGARSTSYARPGAEHEVSMAARSDACILLTGDPNRAQDLAYRLHLASGWRHGPFTVVHCDSADHAIERELFEALFPADDRPDGVAQLRLKQAGTVLLREVNRLPLETQQRLAHRLSEQHAGSRQRCRRRVMATSSEPLLDRVRQGTFDDSLYYRLNVMHFVVDP